MTDPQFLITKSEKGQAAFMLLGDPSALKFLVRVIG